MSSLRRGAKVTMERIFVCADGEDFAAKAEEHAVALAERFGATVTGLYVQSNFLTKFTHEIYAVNRNECRQHLQDSLRNEGLAALEALGRRCSERGGPYESNRSFPRGQIREPYPCDITR
jgi:hypothetical protein